MDLRNPCDPFSLQILRTIAETNESKSLDAAIRANNACLAFLLIEDGATVDDNLFITACAHGRTEIVRFLLALPPERGVDPAARGNEAIQCASENGHMKIVRMLLDLPLERGVNPAVHDNKALRLRMLLGSYGKCSFAA
jgi:ankyrin repeat protein